MATLLSLLSLGQRSRTIRLTSFDYDVIVIVCDSLDLVTFRTFEIFTTE